MPYSTTTAEHEEQLALLVAELSDRVLNELVGRGEYRQQRTTPAVPPEEPEMTSPPASYEAASGQRSAI